MKEPCDPALARMVQREGGRGGQLWGLLFRRHKSQRGGSPWGWLTPNCCPWPPRRTVGLAVRSEGQSMAARVAAVGIKWDERCLLQKKAGKERSGNKWGQEEIKRQAGGSESSGFRDCTSTPPSSHRACTETRGSERQARGEAGGASLGGKLKLQLRPLGLLIAPSKAFLTLKSSPHSLGTCVVGHVQPRGMG